MVKIIMIMKKIMIMIIMIIAELPRAQSARSAEHHG